MRVLGKVFFFVRIIVCHVPAVRHVPLFSVAHGEYNFSPVYNGLNCAVTQKDSDRMPMKRLVNLRMGFIYQLDVIF